MPFKMATPLAFLPLLLAIGKCIKHGNIVKLLGTLSELVTMRRYTTTITKKSWSFEPESSRA